MELEGNGRPGCPALADLLLACRSLATDGRARLLVSSLLGSNIVILAWFPPFVSPTALHSYGLPGGMITFLVAAFAANLAFFLIGLAPAGWLRLRRA